MIKIRLHGTAEEVRHATREIKERFDVLNVSDPYADRGQSVYSRVYIDAETKADDGITLDEFKRLLKTTPIIKGDNIYATYGNAFIFATGFFKDKPVKLNEIESIIADFAANEHLQTFADKLLWKIVKEGKRQKDGAAK